MTRAIQVPLDEATLAALQQLARQEQRHPRMQAAYILERALRRKRAVLLADAGRQPIEALR